MIFLSKNEPNFEGDKIIVIECSVTGQNQHLCGLLINIRHLDMWSIDNLTKLIRIPVISAPVKSLCTNVY